MKRTVTHKFGTSDYQTTALEDFVERLAKEFGVDLPDLIPTESFYRNLRGFPLSKTSILNRGISKLEEDDATSIWYWRSPSSSFFDAARKVPNPNNQFSDDYTIEVIHLVYSDTLYSELAHLSKGDKRVEITFDGHGAKRVIVRNPEIEAALEHTYRYRQRTSNFNRDDAAVMLNFDTKEKAFNFVQNYLLGFEPAVIMR